MRLWRQERWSRWGWGTAIVAHSWLNVRCTNHLMRCRLCPQETGVWKYSLLQHFEQFYEGCDLLQEEVLGDQERDHIINNC